MSVPEYMRRRNSTMFVSTPPFGFAGNERAEDRTASPPWHPPYMPPGEMAYREYPYVGLPPTHMPTPSRGRSQCSSPAGNGMRLVDVVPALWSSPPLRPHSVSRSIKGLHAVHLLHDMERLQMTTEKVASVADGGGLTHATHETAAPASEKKFAALPPLPGLLHDSEYDELDAQPACSSPSTPNDAPSHVNTFPRCPECNCVLKWVFVDRFAGGEHQTHRCQIQCTCDKAGIEINAPRDSVQVSRGAW